MATIEQATSVDTTGFTRTLPANPPASESEQKLLPSRDSMLRFSAPFLPGTFPSSDTLRGYHLGGMIPQYRVPVPAQASAGGAGATTSTTTVTTTSTVTNNPAKAQTAAISTTVLNPGGQYTGVLTMAKAFVVLSVAVSAAARVRLYGTVSAQTTDLTRPITQGPGFGTEQGIIADWNLDTAPIVYAGDPNPVGANGDSPQSSSIYLTVDNIGLASTTIAISVVYVPIQS